MKKIQLTLEEIADMAGISVEELLEISRREPCVAALLSNSPRGVPDSGIPPDPSMYGTLDKYLSDDDDYFL
jgi:hypothetical protein